MVSTTALSAKERINVNREEIKNQARANLYLARGYFGGKSKISGGKLSIKYFTPDENELEKEIKRLEKLQNA